MPDSISEAAPRDKDANQIRVRIYRCIAKTPGYINGVILDGYTLDLISDFLKQAEFKFDLLGKYEQLAQERIGSDFNLVGQVLKMALEGTLRGPEGEA